MKKLVLAALLVGCISQAAGCIIVSGDDDTGNANVAWNLRSFNDATGQVTTSQCPAGANRAIIYALPEGQSADPYEDRYFCTDGAGTAADLPVGRYTIWVRLTDDAYVNRYAESASQIVDIVKGGTAVVPAYDIQTDHAYYQLGWTLHPGGGAAVPCSSVQARTVSRSPRPTRAAGRSSTPPSTARRDSRRSRPSRARSARRSATVGSTRST